MKKAKYLEVAEVIRKRIKDGTYQVKKPLPDQQTLAKELGVSRLTVKKALDGLERQGEVYKQSGLGTFVSEEIPIKSSIDSPANEFTGLRKEMGKNRVTSKVLHFSVEFPDEKLQKYLDLHKTEPVYHIVRFRLLENKPYVIEHTFMPVKLVPDLTDEILHKSVYDYIHHVLHLKFGHAYRRIRATRADDKYDHYLNAGENDPIIELQQIIWLMNGQPIEYSFNRSRFDQRVYTVFENNRF